MTSEEIFKHNVPVCFRDESLKWNGWGYTDSYFTLSADQQIFMTSKRYDELNGKVLPHLRSYIESNLGVDISYETPSIPCEKLTVPTAFVDSKFLAYLRQNDISFTTEPKYRILRSHGQTLHEIMALRTGDLAALGHIPDVVIWPRSESDVEKIVKGANIFNVVVVPIGGGTCVSDALTCPISEKRAVSAVDMTLMDAVIYVDETNFTCRAQAGILGQNLERHLNSRGFTCGHEPDSVEFSSLGGWISTRASGMKKNKYGNIEDILLHANLVTINGTLKKQCQVPRISSGPDLHEVILGSEGTYGIITEATLKICRLSECRRFGSIVFPEFKNGVAFLHEVARQKCQCASLRLVDNEQFRMGQAMKVQSESVWKDITAFMGKLYITRWKGFAVDKIVATTCVFEGTTAQVDQESARLYELAQRFGGIAAGEENGRYGYRLTFAIAYLRDMAMNYSVVGESFETSIAWNRVEMVCHNVKELLKREAKRHGIDFPVIATCRVTQVYDAGACVYFYFGFNYRGLKDPVHIFEKIETAARHEIIACGGSISHHHGVGKLRKKWLPETISPVGVRVLRTLKQELDPQNVFANANLIDAIHSSSTKL